MEMFTGKYLNVEEFLKILKGLSSRSFEGLVSHIVHCDLIIIVISAKT